MSDFSHSGPAQLGFDLGEPPKNKAYEIDPEEIRREMTEILAEARAATAHCPWDERQYKYHKVVFPQMANLLPPDERDQIRIDFAKEIARIELLMAA